MKTCEQCGVEFEPKYPNRPNRFCSRACYNAFGRAGLRPRAKGPRVRQALGHPLTPPSGLVAVARVVLYAKIGPGPHACHWCGGTVDWMPGVGPVAGSLIVDRLDWDRANDAPENLVPSCNHCNSTRTRAQDRRRLGPEEPTVTIGGRPTRAAERVCEHCGKRFLALPAFVRAGKARFCSRTCMYRRRSHSPAAPSAG